MESIRNLQEAALLFLNEVSPGTHADRVQILDCRDRVLVSLVIPAGKPNPDIVFGWDVTERYARFDGNRVAIAPSRLRLLKLLVTAEAPIPAKDLIGTAFDSHTSENNVRFHIAELRKELKLAFPGFLGDPIETDNGYRIVVGV